jgi:hypothetical protein
MHAVQYSGVSKQDQQTSFGGHSEHKPQSLNILKSWDELKRIYKSAAPWNAVRRVKPQKHDKAPQPEERLLRLEKSGEWNRKNPQESSRIQAF